MKVVTGKVDGKKVVNVFAKKYGYYGAVIEVCVEGNDHLKKLDGVLGFLNDKNRFFLGSDQLTKMAQMFCYKAKWKSTYKYGDLEIDWEKTIEKFIEKITGVLEVGDI